MNGIKYIGMDVHKASDVIAVLNGTGTDPAPTFGHLPKVQPIHPCWKSTPNSVQIPTPNIMQSDRILALSSFS
jgi:hypothetical protein